jgi:hypothetical protein
LGHAHSAPRRRTVGSSLPVRNCLPPLALCLVIATALYAPPRVMSQSKTAGEYEVKAAFLYNFAKFVEWPDRSFAGAQSAFTICVLGTDPFGQALDDALDGKMIGSRRVKLERVKDATRARECQVVFVAPSESQRLPEIIDQLRGASVLVVGETDGFAQAGGTVQFTLEQDRVRFTINPDAAERAGLRLSSKLLALAKIVHDASASGRG